MASGSLGLAVRLSVGCEVRRNHAVMGADLVAEPLISWGVRAITRMDALQTRKMMQDAVPMRGPVCRTRCLDRRSPRGDVGRRTVKASNCHYHDDVHLYAGDDWTILGTLFDEGNPLDLTNATITWVLIDADGQPSPASDAASMRRSSRRPAAASPSRLPRNTATTGLAPARPRPARARRCR